MSKRFQKVLTNMFPVSFLETIETDAAHRLVIRVSSDDPSDAFGSMRVRVHHEGEYSDYDISLNEHGEATYPVEDVIASMVFIERIDANGDPLCSDEHKTISYFVDGERQGTRAEVSLSAGCNHEVRIQHERKRTSILHLKKYVACNGEERMPGSNESFTIRIHGQCYSELITLNEENQFHQVLQLSCGMFTITEINDLSDVRYRFNQKMIDDCMIELSEGEHHLDIINEANANTSLTIQKVLRDATGELYQPESCDQFLISIIGDERQMELVLDANNNFCVNVHGLCPGYYSIEELQQDYAASFIVNEGCEKPYAHVCIEEDCQNEVLIINTIENCAVNQTSQLQICAVLRSRDGCVRRPCHQESFQITIEGCGMCQTLNLNENNNYSVDIASLCPGYYEITQVPCSDFATSFSINDDKEKTSARFCVREGQCYQVTIINAEKHAGSLHICKYIRNDYGDLVKPQRDECFDMTLTSCFCKECFTLSCENDWCACFNDLELGSYEVKECSCDYQVEYQIDGKRPNRHARFVMDGCDREVRVINVPYRQTTGTLRIRKYEETKCGELVKPQRDECFHVCVEGDCFKERYQLKASNQWCILLDGLQPGIYHICEEEGEAFDACYVVNGIRGDEACIELGCENQEVCILNHRQLSGSLTIHAVIETCDGQQAAPYDGVCMDILIEGKENCYQVCLSKDNDWCAILEDLPQDTYRIIQKDNLGFALSYEVDGCLQDFARIAMNQEDHNITVVNAMASCAGVVKVTKYVEDEHGEYHMPCPQDEVCFELRGRDFCNTYTLCEHNDFCVYFDDLSEGCYEIEELNACSDVYYLLNKQPYHKAKFNLGNEDVYVDIINKPSQQDSIVIEKRICENGCLCKPKEEDCFKVALSGRNMYEVFELNASNDFCVMIDGLCNQHYEVKELCAGAKTYVIDGCEQDNGYFLYEGCTKQITIINEEDKTGALRLEKLVEDDCGNITRPQRWECFDVLIESECFKRKVTLDASNNFCVCLYDIPCGHYEIQELCPAGCVTYLIHDIPCEKAIVDIVQEDVSVTIINHSLQVGTLHFQGLIEKDGCVMQADPLDEFVVSVCCGEEHHQLVLHAGNDYCASLENLLPGTYLVTEGGKEDLVFAMEDQRFDDQVNIELNGECVEVCVIKVKKKQAPALTITKWMMDDQGNRYRPCPDDKFVITLYHHGKKQMFELNEENGFTKQMMNAAMGSYEVREVDGFASYQVNDGELKSNGCFEVGCDPITVCVCNPCKQLGCIRMSALLQTCDEMLVAPHKDACYQMRLCGEGIQKQVTLSCENNFKCRLELPYGNYQIEMQDDFYMLVDHRKKTSGCIQLSQGVMSVQMVMLMPCATGSIHLEKYIRSADCDCFRKPMMNEEYEVEIIGDSYHACIPLNMDNHYQATVEGLCDGMYEICERRGKHVSYIVNGGMESKQACVEVCGTSHTVKIINDLSKEHKGSIELCKLIKDEEGCYRYPDAADAYWISIKGEEGTSRVLLNEANHFYASVRNLKDGWYEVMEEEGNQVLYVINNGAPMKKGIVHVMNNANTVNVINVASSMKGSIQLCKWMVSQGTRRKPEMAEYQIYISKPGYQNLVVLNEANHYCESISDLEAGTYVVNEIGASKVTYVVDNGSETDRAIVDVNGEEHSVDILNQESEGYNLSFSKLRRINGSYIRPESGMSYDFYLSAPGYQKQFTLNESNNWQLTLENLANATYVLTEVNAVDRVTYVIDEQSEVDRAVIELNNNSHMIYIINTPIMSGGSIRVDKMIREQGELRQPDATQHFTLHVSSPGYNESFLLDSSNNFSVTIPDLADGLYVLDEPNVAFQVSYIIDQGSETTNGIVDVQGSNHQVMMINTLTPPVTGGSIAFRKYVKNANGTLTTPADGDEYTIEVYNEDFLKRVTLNSRNQFQEILSGLKEGVYQMRELDASMYRVTYRINGGEETTQGSVMVNEQGRASVDVINERRDNINTLEVFKYMLDKDGNYLPPEAPNTYDFIVSGYQVDRTYHLEVANDWHATITDLPAGTYQIKEVTQDPATIRYLVNSAQLQEIAVVTQIPDRTNVVGIINLLPGVENGQMTLTKRMRNAQGELVIPTDGEAFVMQVTGENYDRLVSLDRNNNYSYTLTNLAYGNYLISERDASYIVTYQVNGSAENTLGSVNITGGETNEVVVINSQLPNSAVTGSDMVMKATPSPVRPVSSTGSVKIVIE